MSCIDLLSSWKWCNTSNEPLYAIVQTTIHNKSLPGNYQYGVEFNALAFICVQQVSHFVCALGYCSNGMLFKLSHKLAVQTQVHGRLAHLNAAVY